MEPDSPQILYLNTAAGDRIQAMTLAGIRRYAGALGWEVRSVPWQESRPEDIAPLLGAHRPVAGCVVECSDGNSHLPPRLFGRVPVVYLHAAPSLYGGRIVRVSADNEAVARAAFRELSAGHPTAFAAVGVITDYPWSRERVRRFRALCAEAGKNCLVFDRPGETPTARIRRLPGWVAGLPNHCAVFAANDFAAADVVTAARAAGRAIPRNLTLLGVDNNASLCEASRPSITSIQLDHERAGFLAARMIGERAAGASVGPLLAVRRESTRGHGRRELFVLKAVEAIRREACDGLTPATLAARFPGSRRLFDIRFREATGHSVLDEILHIRLERVMVLLSRPDFPIDAIADFSGFGCRYGLRKLFRARYGVSMRQWRKDNAR